MKRYWLWVGFVWGFFLAELFGAQVIQVNASVLNVRSGPSTRYSIVGRIYQGQRYVAVYRSGNWYKIWFRGRTAWCYAGYTTALSQGVALKIQVAGLNVRSGPGTNYQVVGLAHRGEYYALLGRSGNWKKIWFDGKARWCYGGNGYAQEVVLAPSSSQPSQPSQPTANQGRYVHAVDISHWTGYINDTIAKNWKRKGVKHVIAGTQRRNITRQQLQVCVRNGFTVDAYVYLYFRGNMTYQVQKALRTIQGFPVTRLWLDIEDKPTGLSVAQIKAKIWEAIRATKGFPYGIYTGKWWWKYYVKNTKDFSHIPLWYPRYDRNPSLSTWAWQKFGGWKKPWGKQYQGTTRYGGAIVDLNTIKVVVRRRP